MGRKESSRESSYKKNSSESIGPRDCIWSKPSRSSSCSSPSSSCFQRPLHSLNPRSQAATMSRFIRALKPRTLLGLTKQHSVPCIGNQLLSFRRYGSEAVTVSSIPFEAKLKRIIQNEIEYQSQPAPPTKLATRFGNFEVSDTPGNQVTKLKGKFGESEDIEIEVGMFDGCIFVPEIGDDSTGANRHMHLSLLIHIRKGKGLNQLKIICSAWPECLEIQKVAVLPCDQSKPTPYMGPYLKSMDKKIQIPIYEYLEERGIGDELASFLHEYMKNKDRMELIRWFQKVQSLVE